MDDAVAARAGECPGDRLSWGACAEYGSFGSILARAVNDTNVQGSPPWDTLQYIVNILCPGAAEKLKMYCQTSNVGHILAHMVGNQRQTITAQDLQLLISYLTNPLFVQAVEQQKAHGGAPLRDVFVEVRMTVVNLICRISDEDTPAILYAVIHDTLEAYRDSQLVDVCRVLFVPTVGVDTQVFSNFLLDVSSILAPGAISVNVSESFISTTVVRTFFAYVFLLYGTNPPDCLNFAIYSDLFVLTCVPYQFIMPAYFNTYLCRLCHHVDNLSMGVRNMLAEFAVEVLSFELTAVQGLGDAYTLPEDALQTDAVLCSDILQAVKEIDEGVDTMGSTVGMKRPDSADTDVKESATNSNKDSKGAGIPTHSTLANCPPALIALSIAAFPCLPDTVITSAHLSAPFVELSVLLEDFKPDVFTTKASPLKLFSVLYVSEAADNSVDRQVQLAKNCFNACIAHQLHYQSLSLASLFVSKYQQHFVRACLPALQLNRHNLTIDTIIRLLETLHDSSFDTSTTLIELNTEELLSTLFTKRHKQELEDMIYSQDSLQLGYVQCIKLWNCLFLSGNMVTQAHHKMLSHELTTLYNTVGSLQGTSSICVPLCHNLIALSIKEFNRTQSLTDTSPNAIAMPIYLYSSMAMILQLKQHADSNTNKHADLQPHAEVTESIESFIRYLSTTHMPINSPFISALLMFETYCYDTTDEGIASLSTEAIAHTLSPVLSKRHVFAESAAASFFGVKNPEIMIHEQGDASPAMVALILLFAMDSDSFPSMPIFIGAVLSLFLSPTYQKLVLFLGYINSGSLASSIVHQENVILGRINDLHVKSLTSTKTAASITRQQLERLVAKYVAFVHCITIYASLLACVSVFELSFLSANKELSTPRYDGNVISNVHGFLLQHLTSISNLSFTTTLTAARIYQSLKEHAAMTPQQFHDIFDAFGTTISDSGKVMQHLVDAIYQTWSSMPSIVATLLPCITFTSCICYEAPSNLQDNLISRWESFTSDMSCITIALHGVAEQDCSLSDVKAPNTAINLTLNLLYMAYALFATFRAIIHSYRQENAVLTRSRGLPDSTLYLTACKLDICEVYVEEIALYAFSQLLPTILKPLQSLPHATSPTAEPQPKLSPGITPYQNQPHIAHRYIFYMQLSSMVIPFCTVMSRICTQAIARTIQKQNMQATANMLIHNAIGILNTIDESIFRRELIRELASAHASVQKLLCYAPSDTGSTKYVSVCSALFSTSALATNLSHLTILHKNRVNWTQVYCSAWRLLVLATHMSVTLMKKVDHSYIGVILILLNQGLSIQSYCILRGLFVSKLSKQKNGLRAIICGASQKCMNAKGGVSFVPKYAPLWRPSFSAQLVEMASNFSSYLEESSPHAQLLPLLVSFSEIVPSGVYASSQRGDSSFTYIKGLVLKEATDSRTSTDSPQPMTQ